MKILGISALDTDCTASLLVDGELVECMAEERLSRIKLHAGFPAKSIEMIFQRTGLTPNNIDSVAYAFYPWTKEAKKMSICYFKNFFYNITRSDSLKAKFFHEAYYLRWTKNAILDHRKFHHELINNLKKIGLEKKLVRVEHHLCHAASAFYTSGFDRALIVTLDAYGSGLAGSISIGTLDGIKRVLNIE